MEKELIQRKLEETENEIRNLEENLGIAMTTTPNSDIEDRALYIRVQDYEHRLGKLRVQSEAYKQELGIK